MDNFLAKITIVNLAKHAQPCADLQGLLLVGIEIEKAQRHPTAIVGDPRHQLSAGTKRDFAINHLNLKLRSLTGARIGNSRDACFIFVTQRQMHDEISIRAQTQPRQLGD